MREVFVGGMCLLSQLRKSVVEKLLAIRTIVVLYISSSESSKLSSSTVSSTSMLLLFRGIFSVWKDGELGIGFSVLELFPTDGGAVLSSAV